MDNNRKINLDDYDKKRKRSRVELLKLRDRLPKMKGGGLNARDKEKQKLLFKLAKKNRENIMKKIGDREYQLLG